MSEMWRVDQPAKGSYLPAEQDERKDGGDDMSGSVNKVTLLGHLGADPEVRSFQNGGQVCNLRIATSESWKDKTSGERKERTEWHNVAIFSEPLVGIAERYLTNGSKIYIEGQLETRKWQDQSGNDRYSTEVVMRPFNGKLVLLDSKAAGERREEPSGRAQEAHMGGGAMDDDIPFAMEWRG